MILFSAYFYYLPLMLPGLPLKSISCSRGRFRTTILPFIDILLPRLLSRPLGGRRALALQHCTRDFLDARNGLAGGHELDYVGKGGGVGCGGFVWIGSGRGREDAASACGLWYSCALRES